MVPASVPGASTLKSVMGLGRGAGTGRAQARFFPSLVISAFTSNVSQAGDRFAWLRAKGTRPVGIHRSFA